MAAARKRPAAATTHGRELNDLSCNTGDPREPSSAGEESQAGAFARRDLRARVHEKRDRCVLACSGEVEGRRTCGTNEKPDLILLDLMMPGQDGWHVAKALSDDEATNRIPIVFLSAFAQPADRARGLESGAIGYYHEAVQPAAAASDGARVPWASRRSTSENTRRWRGARHVSAPDELDPRRLAVVAARLTAFHSCTLTIRAARVRALRCRHGPPARLNPSYSRAARQSSRKGGSSSATSTRHAGPAFVSPRKCGVAFTPT